MDHPTREEWESRRAAAPAPVLAILTAAADRDNEARRQEAEREADELAAFERGLREFLCLTGLDWLAEYRGPDALWTEAMFRTGVGSWSAAFDLTRWGLHPIRVDLVPDSPAWRPHPAGAFTVLTPRGVRDVSTFAAAVEVAAVYCATPF